MTINLSKLIPVLPKPKRIAHDNINPQMLLEVSKQVINEIISQIPEKHSGFTFLAYFITDLYCDMKRTSYEKNKDILNKTFMPYIRSLHRFKCYKIGDNKHRRAIPDQPSMCRFAQMLANNGLAENYHNLLLKAQIIIAQNLGLIKDEVTLIADYVENPCMKKQGDPYRFKNKNGKFKQKTLTFSIISGDLHLIFAAFKIKKCEYKKPFFEQVVADLTKLGLKIKYGLFDRGFYRKDLLSWLHNQEITVIMPGRKCTDSKRKIRLWLQDKSGRTGVFRLNVKYVKKHGWKVLMMGVVLEGKRGYKLDEVKQDYKTGNSTLDAASKCIFPLLVIRGNSRSIRVLDSNAHYLRDLYRKRWAIEIAFRQTHLIGISNWVQSRDTRLGRFIMKCAVYNLWQMSRVLLKQSDPTAADLTLDEFCGRMSINRTPIGLYQKNEEILVT